MMNNRSEIKANTLWYTKSAQKWTEATALGNGRLGAMVCGRVYTERIYLNEDSVWSGGPQQRNNRDTLEFLPKIRELVMQGNVREAERLAPMVLTGTPESQRHYQPLGDLFIYFPGEKTEIIDYRRSLDMACGVLTVQYTQNGVKYTRTAFCSYPDHVMVVHITADKPNSICLSTQLSRGSLQLPFDNLYQQVTQDMPLDDMPMPHPCGFQGLCDGMTVHGSDTLVMNGTNGGSEGIAFSCVLRAVPQGGKVRTIGDYLVTENADSLMLILSANTSFRYAAPAEECMATVNRAASQPFEQLLKSHSTDHSSLFNRVDIQLGTQDDVCQQLQRLSTDVRLDRVRQGQRDLGLICLCFQFGRYLLIACSRPGSLPATLQGIWTTDILPFCDSKYTININTQMNYWLAEKCNLSELHMPLFDHLERMKLNGKETAQKMYNCRGFVAHHNTDIWADTAPQDSYRPATYWTMGGAWLCLHIWDHYEFTGDRQFLEEKFDTLLQAALFFCDFLIDDGNGNLVTCPSVSPENSYYLSDGRQASMCMAPAMDLEILAALFDSVIKAANVLQCSNDSSVDEIRSVSSRLLKPTIGEFGQVREWYADYPETEITHRHMSPIFALFPGEAFTPQVNEQFAQAARINLDRKLTHWKVFKNWIGAWLMNLLTRLGDGEKAAEVAESLVANSFSPNLFDQLFELDFSFQIDGNCAFTSGIAEMLLQSHAGQIILLPALPAHWQCGFVNGLVARGGFVVDIRWEGGKIKNVGILSNLGSICRVLLEKGYSIIDADQQPVAVTVVQGLSQFNTMKGQSYHIVLA